MITDSSPSENGCENSADGQRNIEHYETQREAKRIKIENRISTDFPTQEQQQEQQPSSVKAPIQATTNTTTEKSIEKDPQTSNDLSNKGDYTAGEASAVSMRVQSSQPSSTPTPTPTHNSTHQHSDGTSEASGSDVMDSSKQTFPCKVKAEPPQMKKQQSPPPPLKSTTMSHLRKKYMTELQYMHREFKKLEKQLLGAKTGAKNSADEFASRERREKLHSFIMHLESTMKEISSGCAREENSKGQVTLGNEKKDNMEYCPSLSGDESMGMSEKDEEEAKKEFANSSALTKLTKEKEAEENVQKLEEHILANLLPVKVRLTKQLAAQQGAARNPAGMPLSRRGLQPAPGSDKGKGTFAAAAEQKRLAQIQLQQQQQHDEETSSIGPLHPHGNGPVVGPTAHSQFGKPLQGGGSSLTQKLHGATLGSKHRSDGDGVGQHCIKGSERTTPSQDDEHGTTPPSKQKKIQYAGMTPGSSQIQSGVCAAKGIHDMMVESPMDAEESVSMSDQTSHLPNRNTLDSESANTPCNSASPDCALSSTQDDITVEQTSVVGTKPQDSLHNVQGPVPHFVSNQKKERSKNQKQSPKIKVEQDSQASGSRKPFPTTQSVKKSLRDPNLTEEERQKIKERRKERKLEKRRAHLLAEKERQKQMMAQQQAANLRHVKAVSSSRPTTTYSKGPRNVEYICALCNETYNSMCEYNPWWALTSHECIKCGKTQIPRLDISAPTNAIEYHPALLAHATVDDNNETSSSLNTVTKASQFLPSQKEIPPPETLGGSKAMMTKSSDRKGGHRSDDDFSTSDSDDSECDENLSASAQAENEDFGSEYSGPKFTDYDSSRLLALMTHASTCPGQHKNPKVHNTCLSAKYLMLHVRDCPGTTSSYDICPYPWCRKTKHLLYHLVSCASPDQCPICSPKDLSQAFTALGGLNSHRNKKHKQRMCIPVPANAPKKISIPPIKKKRNQDNKTSKPHSTTSSEGETKRTTKKTSQGVRRSHGGAVLIGMSQVLPSQSIAKKPLSVPSPLPENTSLPNVKIEDISGSKQVVLGQTVHTPRTNNVSSSKPITNDTKQDKSAANAHTPGPNFPALPTSLPKCPVTSTATKKTQLKPQKQSSSPLTTSGAVVTTGERNQQQKTPAATVDIHQNVSTSQQQLLDSSDEKAFSETSIRTPIESISSRSIKMESPSIHHGTVELKCDNHMDKSLQPVEVSDETRCSNTDGSNSSDSSNSFDNVGCSGSDKPQPMRLKC